MFIKELGLNINYLKEQVSEHDPEDAKAAGSIQDFGQNLLKGISYYHDLSSTLPCDPLNFKVALNKAEDEIKALLEGMFPAI